MGLVYNPLLNNGFDFTGSGGGGGGVTSVNGVTGAVTLAAGSGITLTPSGSTITIASTGGGSGTVTSVGLSLPNIFTVTGSPITGSGTLTGTLASQSTNLIFASPNGSSGVPTFRSLVSTDIPSLSYANQTLSNLNTTSVNQSLIPGTNNTLNLGQLGNTIIASATFTNSYGREFVDSTTFSTTRMSEAFQPAANVSLSSVNLSLTYQVNPATGNLVLTIQSDNGSGHPSGTALSTVLIDVSTFPVFNSSVLPALITANLSSSLPLTSGTKYHIVLDFSGVTLGSGTILGWSNRDPSPGSVNAIGAEISTNSGSTWIYRDLAGPQHNYFIANSAATTTWANGYFGTSIQTPSLVIPGSTSGTLTINSSAITTSYSIIMPSVQGAANTVLTNNGSGVLSWSASSSSTFNKENITLSSTNITNQYVDLAHLTIANSLTLAVTKTYQVEGSDYTLSTIGGVTRLSFAGDLATGGVSALVAGNILNIQYTF